MRSRVGRWRRSRAGNCRSCSSVRFLVRSVNGSWFGQYRGVRSVSGSGSVRNDCDFVFRTVTEVDGRGGAESRVGKIDVFPPS